MKLLQSFNARIYEFSSHSMKLSKI